MSEDRNREGSPAGDSVDEGGTGAQPATKRRRTALACTSCRIRKSRCNGMRPKCEPCSRLGFDCSYEVPDTAANLIVQKDVFTALEERIKLLEKKTEEHNRRLDANDYEGSQGSRAARNFRRQPDLQELTPETVLVNIENQDPETQMEDAATDGMAISFVPERDTAFFGESSNIAFMRQIFRVMVQQGSSAGLERSGFTENPALPHNSMISGTMPADSPSNLVTGVRVTPNALPAPAEAQKLIRTYFSNTGLLYPFLHEPTFFDTYQRMSSPGYRSPVKRTWLGLLNMVFAMATCTGTDGSDSTTVKSLKSDVFYRRAKELCNTQMLRGTTLETVQYLILCCQYLQGTQQSVRTWTAHGLAVKAAFSIGLHSRGVSRSFDPIEREMRNRTWYGLISLDRSMSMTFGRPGAIPEDYVKIDLPKPFASNSISSYDETSVSFFNATITLYRVLWKTIASLYDQNLGSDDVLPDLELTTRVFRLEQELEGWKRQLPDNLQLRSAEDILEGPPDDPIIERFRLILTLRYLNIQVLLHRPILTRSLFSAGPTGNSDFRNPFSHMPTTFSNACVNAAEETVCLIHAVLTSQSLGKRLIGAWWFTLYYTFNASLAVFASLLLPTTDAAGQPLPNKDQQLVKGKALLQKAIDSLVQLDTENAVVDRCVECLQRISAGVGGGSTLSTSQLYEPGQDTSQLGYPRFDFESFLENMDSDFLGPVPNFGAGEALGGNELELGQFFPDFKAWF